MTSNAAPHNLDHTARLHLQIGWWMMASFLALGIVLESLHGLKIDWYLNVANETRRLMWTLAHAHGTLLGLIHLAFAFSVYIDIGPRGARRKIASICLTSGGILLPLGFLLGGIVIYDSHPGLGILLVPLGAALLLFAVVATAWSVTQATRKRPS